MKKTAKLTLVQTFGLFLRLVYKSVDFWRGMLLYSAVLTAFYHISLCGQYICRQNSFSCLITIQFIILITLFLGALCYIVDFYQSTFKNSVFKCGSIISFDKNKLKSIVFLIAYTMVFAISGYFAKIIIVKPANHVWQIEFIYFVMFFIFCLLPVMAMRFSAAVAFYLHEQKAPSFKFLYDKTAGHSFISIVGFLAIILLLTVFNIQVYGYENAFLLKFPHSISVVILTTFVDAFIKLLSLNVIVCFFEAQRELMENQTLTATDENNTLPAKKSTEEGKKVKKKTKSNRRTRQ